MEMKAQIIFATDNQQFLFGYIAFYSNCFLDKTELCELQFFISSLLATLFCSFFPSCIRLNDTDQDIAFYVTLGLPLLK